VAGGFPDDYVVEAVTMLLHLQCASSQLELEACDGAGADPDWALLQRHATAAAHLCRVLGLPAAHAAVKTCVENRKTLDWWVGQGRNPPAGTTVGCEEVVGWHGIWVWKVQIGTATPVVAAAAGAATGAATGVATGAAAATAVQATPADAAVAAGATVVAATAVAVAGAGAAKQEEEDGDHPHKHLPETHEQFIALEARRLGVALKDMHWCDIVIQHKSKVKRGVGEVVRKNKRVLVVTSDIVGTYMTEEEARAKAKGEQHMPSKTFKVENITDLQCDSALNMVKFKLEGDPRTWLKFEVADHCEKLEKCIEVAIAAKRG